MSSEDTPRPPDPRFNQAARDHLATLERMIEWRAKMIATGSVSPRALDWARRELAALNWVLKTLREEKP